MNPINKSIFREYDIRGIVATELQDDVVERIAAACASMFAGRDAKRIALGFDGRPSSPHIAAVVAETLAGYGCRVIEIGLVSTPLLYFAVHHWQLDGGIMVTASHNPPEYNGFKIQLGKASLAGEQIREIYETAQAGSFPASAEGSREKRDVLEEYLDYVAGNVKLGDRKIKVVVDAGNGTGGISAGPLYRRLGVEVIEIYCDVDGDFPNHHPDPTKEENLQDLIAAVKKHEADLGLAFDGDGDRIGVVDHAGQILWGDQILLVFALDLLGRHPGATIISEVKASRVFYDEVERHGGRAVMYKTGHSLIKNKIAETGAQLAGEVSGHIFFNDKWFGFDDAVYAGARLLEILSFSDKNLARIRESFPPVFNTPEIRIDTTEEAKFAIVAEVCRHFKENYQVNDIDGARISFPHGWALVRASNTQPALVVRFEADTPAHLNEIQTEVTKVVKRFQKSQEG